MDVLKTGASSSQGSILLLAVWVLTFCGLVVASLSFRFRLDLKLTQYRCGEIQLAAVAQEALATATLLIAQKNSIYSTLNQAWANDPAAFQNKITDDGVFTVCSHREEPNGQTSDAFGLEDESGKLSLNRATADQLATLLGNLSVAQAIVQSRSDQKKGYGRSGPFQSVDEMLLIPGVTSALYKQGEPNLTVAGSGAVNINTASWSVLSAIGFPDPLIHKVLLFRAGPDGKIGTSDDGVFENLGSAVATLSEQTALTAKEASIFSSVIAQDELSVQSEAYRAEITTRLPGSPVGRHFSVVFVPSACPPRILYWREQPL